MKATFFKPFLILSGLMLIGSKTMCGGVIKKITHTLNDEISTFDISALYAVIGIITICFLFYFISKWLSKAKDKPSTKAKFSHIRHRNHQAILRKKI